MSELSATRSKTEAEIKRSQESSFLDALVPIPDFFYNIKAEIEPIGGSKSRIRIYGYILYFITLCVMFGSFAYYSLPAQRVRLESIVTSEWKKTGFACKPLQETTLHGTTTEWSFDECVANVIAPDTTNVKAATKHANAIHYDYNFASDGHSKISFYDEAYADSVVQNTNQATDDWKRDGYSCYPEPPYDNTYNLNYNFSECRTELEFRPPSVESVQFVPNAFQTTNYFPFEGGSCFPRSGLAICSAGFMLESDDCSIMDDNGPGDLQSSVDCWTTMVADLDIDDICEPFKLNGNGFRCYDKPKPPATKELAIDRYTSEYPPAVICAPLKLNSPFQCTRSVELPATTRLSLSVAAAQAVFAALGLVIVALLRKLYKPAESSSGDDDIRSVVRKLHITVDKLDTEFRTGQKELRTGQDRLDSKVDQLGTGHGEHEVLIQKLLKK